MNSYWMSQAHAALIIGLLSGIMIGIAIGVIIYETFDSKNKGEEQ